MTMVFSQFCKKNLTLLTLIAVCAGSFLLVLPTINANISDPNMIVYFNADEGGMMDLVWYYYSGQKRNSFQWDYDYGLELRYIADIARFIPPRFLDFTPGKFVLIIRWLHLIAWLLALVALWRFVGRHFGKGWQQSLAVLLLGTRPSFSYFSSNLKPEPLVLLFTILGLDYTLRIIKGNSWKNLLIAVSIMTLAFLTKYIGIFSIPALIASMYFAETYQRSVDGRKTIFPQIRIAWILPSLIGFGILILLSSAILFYVRKCTGRTWCEEFGFWGALTQSRSMRYLFSAATILIPLSFIILMLNKARNRAVRGATHFINIINSHAFIVCALFFISILIFGFRWIVSPKNFLLTYSQIAPAAASEYIAQQYMFEKNFVFGILQNAIQKLSALDSIIVILFAFYVLVEAFYFRRNLAKEPLKVYKRLVLVVFIMPIFLLILSGLRIASHHMLPYFAVMSVLVLQSVNMWRDNVETKKILKKVVVIVMGVVLTADIVFNGIIMVKSKLIESRRNGDISLEAARWFYDNIPADARMVTDFYTRVYISPQYKNIKSFNWCRLDHDKIENLRSLVRNFKPEFIYYNANSTAEDPMLPIHEILPGLRIEPIKAFDSDGHSYARIPGDKFVIYRVVYGSGLH